MKLQEIHMIKKVSFTSCAGNVLGPDPNVWFSNLSYGKMRICHGHGLSGPLENSLQPM